MRQQIIEVARSWIGTPNHHLGRLKGVGVDCLGLLLGVLEECGIKKLSGREEFAGYRKVKPHAIRMIKTFDRLLEKRAALQSMLPGDVAIFWISERTKEPRHLAILTDRGLLHVYRDAVAEHVMDQFWRARFICGYSIV